MIVTIKMHLGCKFFFYTLIMHYKSITFSVDLKIVSGDQEYQIL